MFVLRWYDSEERVKLENRLQQAARSRPDGPEKPRLQSQPNKPRATQTQTLNVRGSEQYVCATRRGEARGASLTECWHFVAGSVEERVRKIGGWGQNPFGRERKKNHVFGDQRRSAFVKEEEEEEEGEKERGGEREGAFAGGVIDKARSGEINTLQPRLRCSCPISPVLPHRLQRARSGPLSLPPDPFIREKLCPDRRRSSRQDDDFTEERLRSRTRLGGPADPGGRCFSWCRLRQGYCLCGSGSVRVQSQWRLYDLHDWLAGTFLQSRSHYQRGGGDRSSTCKVSMFSVTGGGTSSSPRATPPGPGLEVHQAALRETFSTEACGG